MYCIVQTGKPVVGFPMKTNHFRVDCLAQSFGYMIMHIRKTGCGEWQGLGAHVPKSPKTPQTPLIQIGTARNHWYVYPQKLLFDLQPAAEVDKWQKRMALT